MITEADKNMIGVYKIESPSGKTYVGMTCVSFASRLSGHLKYLKNGKHHCKGLQRAYDKYGQDNLKFTVLEKWENPNSYEMEALGAAILARESFWWRKIRSEGTLMYNGEPSGTGSVFHTEETKLRIAESRRKDIIRKNRIPICEIVQHCMICDSNFTENIIRKTCSDICLNTLVSNQRKSRAYVLPDYDLVSKIWLDDELSVIECQEILDVRSGRFYKILDQLDLPRRPKYWVAKKDMPSRESLVTMYSIERRSLKKIQEKFCLSEKKLRFVIEYYSIPERFGRGC